MPNPRLPSYLLPLALAALASLSGISGCIFSTKDSGNDRVAGGAEDFPNTIALGAAVAGHVSDHSDWDQFSVIPSTLPSFQEADSLVVPQDTASPIKPVPVAGKVLGKTSAGEGIRILGNLSDTVTWDFSDTASLGVARRFHSHGGLLKVHRDTTVFRYDANLRDTIAGNELVLLSKGVDIYFSGRIQAYRYENKDSAGGFDRAVFYDRIPLAGTSVKTRIVIILPGPDGDINTKADNVPAYYASTVTKPSADGSGALDTTEAFEITDADGDGALWGAGDSGLVDFKQKTSNPIYRPSVDLIVQKMRARLYKDEQKTYPVSFSETRFEKDGKKVIFSVKGTGADSTFGPGDTAWISVHTFYPENAKLLEKHSRYHVLLGGQPKRYQDNELLFYSLEATWRKDSLTVTRLTMTPDAPILSKELAITGNLSVDVDYSDGGTGLASGRFQNRQIDVNLTKKSREGKERKFHVLWDAFGKILSQTRVD